MSLLARLARWASRPLETQGHGPAGAIVVLGAPLRPDGSLTAVVEERVRAGVMLWRQGAAPLLCVTGGRNAAARHEGSEADAMAGRARALGVPEDALRVERASCNTRENALRCAEVLGRGTRVWLVTTPFHLRRAALWFRRAGLIPLGVVLDESVQFDDPVRGLRWVAREYVALARDCATRSDLTF